MPSLVVDVLGTASKGSGELEALRSWSQGRSGWASCVVGLW